MNDDIRLRKITALLGITTVGRTLECMAIAEDEIAKAEKRSLPLTRAHVRNVFGLAMPGRMIEYTTTLYRAHVRELCERALSHQAMHLATEAEIVMVLSEGSLVVPLNAQHGALYEELFHKIFGHYVGKKNQRVQEPYNGATSELLHTMRRKFQKEERKIT